MGEKGIEMGQNQVQTVREVYPDLIAVRMDESDWKFVIDSLRFRERKSVGDTVERAKFTADSIQDVLDSAS